MFDMFRDVWCWCNVFVCRETPVFKMFCRWAGGGGGGADIVFIACLGVRFRCILLNMLAQLLKPVCEKCRKNTQLCSRWFRSCLLLQDVKQA